MCLLLILAYIIYRPWFDICTTLFGLNFLFIFFYIVFYFIMLELENDLDYPIWHESYVLDSTIINFINIKIFYFNFKKNIKIFFFKIYYNIFNNSFLKIFYKSFFKWSPIFKKTSYFGLFIASKNK